MNHARRRSFLLLACVLLTLAGAWAASRSSLTRQADERGNSSRANAVAAHRTTPAVPHVAPPQNPPPFELSQSVIAGGGGTSSANVAGTPIRLDGTIGQAGAGTTSTSSNGQFSVTGGFWQPQATPTPTPTPTPNPNAPYVFVEEGTVNKAAAVDSVTRVKGPFRILTNHNFSTDGHTRLIIFTSNLGLSQPDPSILTVQAAGFPLTVENVGPVTGVAGLNASYIIVRLPDGLPSGDLPVTVILNGVASINAPTISISP